MDKARWPLQWRPNSGKFFFFFSGRLGRKFPLGLNLGSGAENSLARLLGQRLATCSVFRQRQPEARKFCSPPRPSLNMVTWKARPLPAPLLPPSTCLMPTGGSAFGWYGRFSLRSQTNNSVTNTATPLDCEHLEGVRHLPWDAAELSCAAGA